MAPARRSCTERIIGIAARKRPRRAGPLMAYSPLRSSKPSIEATPCAFSYAIGLRSDALPARDIHLSARRHHVDKFLIVPLPNYKRIRLAFLSRLQLIQFRLYRIH